MCECPFSDTLTSTAYFHFCVSCVKFLSKATAALFSISKSVCFLLTSGSSSCVWIFILVMFVTVISSQLYCAAWFALVF